MTAKVADMRIERTRVIVLCAATILLAAAHRIPADPSGRLFFLDLRGGRVVSAATDGSDVKVLISGRTGIPDGIAIDTDAGHIYWTIMGKAAADDGMIERIDLDGGHLTTIVPAGGTFTPKQLKLDPVHRKLYWADREGMRIMRANLDGTRIETLIETGHGETDRRNPANWCVGIALDVSGGKIYWTQKGSDNGGIGSLRRANMELPSGQDASRRSDIEVLFEHLPEPIDLDLDLARRMIYWTDRGANIVSRATIIDPVRTDALRPRLARGRSGSAGAPDTAAVSTARKSSGARGATGERPYWARCRDAPRGPTEPPRPTHPSRPWSSRSVRCVPVRCRLRSATGSWASRCSYPSRPRPRASRSRPTG